MVCELSRPFNLSGLAGRSELDYIEGGVLALPGGCELRAKAELAPGQAYACMAETLTLGLTPKLRPARLGELTSDAVVRIALAARSAGFALAGAKRERSY